MAARAPTVISYGFAKERGVVVLPKPDAEPETSPETGPETGPETKPEPAPETEPGSVRIGLRQGASASALIEVRRALGRRFTVEPLSPAAFDECLSQAYAVDRLEAAELEQGLQEGDDLTSLIEGIPQTADLLDAEDDAPIIRLINGIIAEAIRAEASDIHVEPYEGRLSVRLRIDGVLTEVADLSARLSSVIISRLKVMARLDIAEKRVPQDGRMSLSLGGRSLDVRVSTLPSRHGERVVLRLLDKGQARLDLDHLGMPADTLQRLKAALSRPNGILLVTGPTGSGKTTTLYAGLTLLNDQSRNILTVEDPIEYGLEGIGQTQVNAKVGMSFAAGLRAILRQDPDIVMVGEIRDLETVQIAVQAALTGHLVLSTVHTNSAAAAITRLRDMGVEPFLLSSTVKAILAQRLVRRLCPACKRTAPPTPAEAAYFTGRVAVPEHLCHPVGCERCNRTGFVGRLGLYELISVDADVRAMIHAEADEDALAARGLRDADSLLDSGLRRVAEGATALEEVLRVAVAPAQG
ncbi:MAG: type II secretion system ATPase GspE [Rhodothalassiaceae bacterium]